MAVYRFRVAFEDYDDVVRDIEIKSTQTFEDFHLAIQKAIGFDNSKPSSFYMSDDNWKKGKEITTRELNESEQVKAAPVSSARLLDFIADPHQKIYYVFDLPGHWTFRIELVKIIVNTEAHVEYPRCTRTIGEAPKQYGNIIAGPLPVPEDFEGDEIIEESAEEIFSESADVVDVDEVPVAVESEETPLGDVDLEEEGDRIIDDDETKDSDEF